MLENVELTFRYVHAVSPEQSQCAKVIINSCVSGSDVDKIIELFQESVFKFDETSCDIKSKGQNK